MKLLLVVLITVTWAILVTSVIDPPPPMPASGAHISSVDVLRYELIANETVAWKNLGILNTVPDLISMTGDELADELAEMFAAFDRHLNTRFPTEPTYYGPEQLGSSWIWARATSELRKVTTLYEAFRRFLASHRTSPPGVGEAYAKPKPAASRQAWTDIADNVVHGAHSVPKFSDTMQEFILKEKLFEFTLREANSDLCSLHQSPQQLLYNLYNTITLTELKGYAMMQFSYMLLRVFEKGNYTQEAASMRERYEDRSIQTIAAVKRAMTGASRQLWVCDPKTHVEGETFVRLTRLLQGYIENEVDMNSEQSCSENCAAYSYTTNYGCYKDQFCAKQTRCNGKIIKCQYIDSDMWVCPARERSGRRYEYIEYENGRILGHKQTCISGTSKVDSWWRWIFWHCSYCMCFCDEQGINSDRYFNMRDVVAWVEKNRVVTGLRFVKVNRIIHLQIQQGELLPRANIDPATLEWLPVDDYNLLDANVRNGVDYHTLTWDNRGIDLDDLLVPNNHVLTGVRFRKVGGHLNFEIQYCEFNFTTGKLINPKNRFYWLSNDNTDGSFLNPRLQLTLQTPDVPTRSHVPSAPDSQTNQFIEFTHSDLDRDAAQTTVPYLDAQSVTPEFVVPLMGAGIYHKGQLGSGGYVAPKVFTYDYSRHMKSLFPIK